MQALMAMWLLYQLFHHQAGTCILSSVLTAINSWLTEEATDNCIYLEMWVILFVDNALMLFPWEICFLALVSITILIAASVIFVSNLFFFPIPILIQITDINVSYKDLPLPWNVSHVLLRECSAAVPVSYLIFCCPWYYNAHWCCRCLNI